MTTLDRTGQDRTGPVYKTLILVAIALLMLIPAGTFFRGGEGG